MNEILHYLQEKKISYFLDEPIKPYVTMNIGGTVKLLAIVKKNADLHHLIARIKVKGLPHVLIGGGSNVVFSDGYSPIIVIINRTADIALRDQNSIRVSSGLCNRELIRWCIKNGMSGLEFLAGIPGSIGGAAAVNAGAFGRSISDILETAEIIDEKGVAQQVNRHFFQYQYRHSIFKLGSKIILNLCLHVLPSDPHDIKSRVNSNLKYRKEKHPPYNQYTAGCFFKNPMVNNRRISAGKIIKHAQMREEPFPHLKISDKHANFIINTGNAEFRDLATLEKKIRERILKSEQVKLEREVIFISSDGEKK